ncbi:type I restriction endonuclease subunit R [Paenibacillus psychroresistens]|uniref:Type I restriction endonuclease subunit R n=1 Tax=Paenibacillus psychroresistens TaxID=1778678 RepID=A0A6B8RQI4_9BACL|nr:DEAD/DEAH box helicase family protein [Paenibacillus psychroresistens]QGQ97548.1 type I restriction endonuclease subunit R [Paenibacillus psychroresistens]
MNFSITSSALKERSFQSLIKDYLIAENGYIESLNIGYDQKLALDVDQLFSFLETSQYQQMNKLKEIYKTNYTSKVLNNLERELRTRGSIDVLKHGIKDYGVKLNLAYFKSPTDFNPDQAKLYQKNILSVTEELIYNEDKRIDLVIFLNGVPIITIELKNAFTGQTYKNAITQYKQDRSHTEQLFRFKERSIVNFAMDTDVAFMTTKLSGVNTIFLPFNKGVGDHTGNPIVEGKLNTHYIWEDILKKDILLEIIHKFAFVSRKEEILENGDKIMKEAIIFPRYHQLDVVKRVLQHVRQHGSGERYLIQHSAGSGKTNSITWLTHRLASLHDSANNIIFNGVIVITDRKVLDQQLQDSIYQLEHKIGLVAKIDDDSNQLATEIEKGTKIIISTIQKFPYLLEKLSGTKGKKFAIVIDEAHSSTTGRNMMALKESLSLEEATTLAMREEAEELDSEDKINIELEKLTRRDNVSFFAFTATPKGSTLKLFGVPYDDGKHYPFHLYSMRQAIEEGFIHDVLKHYMTYKMFYNVNKKIEDDPSFSKSKANKSIARFVSLHPHNISQKTEVIIEHFRNSTMKRIGGEAKAMLVTSSRLHAVRYKLAFDEYIRLKGYSDLKTLVAFSGLVKDDGEEYKETQMNNGVSESQLPNQFDKEESRILIVANKYQTGFDQPKLHTMYVDKKLSGVKAVQTLSRLNRIYPGKEDTFVLDFVNEPDEMKESFIPFYQVTVLDNDIEPNEIYALERMIYDKQVIDRADVILFTEIFYKDLNTPTDISIMNNCVNHAVNRMTDFTKEEIIDFKSLISKFINLYMLIIQVAPIIDTDLHRLSIYLRFLIKKIEIESTGGVNITDKVMLEYYRLEKKTEGSIYLNNDNQGVGLSVGGSGNVKEEPVDYLSNIIDNLNKKYGTSFSESEKLAVDQIRSNLKANKELELNAQENSYEVFKHAFHPKFLDGVVKEYDKNQVFYGKILRDEGFRDKLMDLIMLDIYSSFKETKIQYKKG